MMGQDSLTLAENLDEFVKELKTLPDVERPPKTTLEVLERRQREDYWNRLFRYFLDPAEAHGVDDEILSRFLRHLEKEHDDIMELEISDDLKVISEALTEEGSRVDVLVLTDAWFVVIELKVTADEGADQTERYIEESLEDVSDSAEGFYVYISKEDADSPQSEEFVNTSWNDISAIFDDVLRTARGMYSERALHQLRDFRDSIANEENMKDNEFNENQTEKTKLYLKYREDIDNVQKAFNDLVKRENERWGEYFLENHKPSSWDDSWHISQERRNYIFKDGWWLDGEGEPCENRNDAVYMYSFRHYLDEDRIGDGVLQFRCYSRNSNPDTYRDTIEDLVTNEYREELETELSSLSHDFGGAEKSIDYEGRKNSHTQTNYSLDVLAESEAFYEDLPEVYYRTLEFAFDQHEPLTELLTEIHLEAVEADLGFKPDVL